MFQQVPFESAGARIPFRSLRYRERIRGTAIVADILRKTALAMTMCLVGCLSATFGCKAPPDNAHSLLGHYQYQRVAGAITPIAPLPRGGWGGHWRRSKPGAHLSGGDVGVSSEANELLFGDMLTLKESRSIALRNNPDIHAVEARLEAAAARVASAQALYAPTVVFTHHSARTFQTPTSRNRLSTLLQPVSALPVDIDRNTSPLTTLLDALRRPLFGGETLGNANSFSEHVTALTVSWVAFDGFTRDAALLAAKYLRQASALAVTDVERLILGAVDSAYYQVQGAEEQLRIAQVDEAFSREQLAQTQKLRAAGRATTADVDNFRVRVLAAQADVSAATGLRDTGRVVLAELMGLPGATLPHDLALSPLVDEAEEEMTAPGPESWIEAALAHRPGLQQLKQVLDSERQNVRAARGFFLPTVVLSGSWGFDHSSNLRYEAEDQSSAAGMEVRWQIYTGGSRRAKVWEAQSTYAETAAKLERLRLSVIASVRQAIINVHNAQQQILIHRENVATARKNRRIIQAAYVAGKETLLRLNEAQRDFINAEANLALARIRLRQAWSDLRSAAATDRSP